jgi:PAS domain S-box-containing protein
MELWRRSFRHPAGRWAAALLLVAGASGLRALTTPWLGSRAPFVLYFPAVLAAGWLGGLAPGIAAAFVSAVVATLFLGHGANLRALTAEDWGNLLVFLVVSIFLLLAVESARRARNRAEELIRRERESQRTVDSALDAAQVGYWSWDLATGNVTWSRNLESVHRLPPGSFSGNFEAFLDLVHSEDRKLVREAIDRALSEGKDYDIDFRVVPPGGEVQWINGRGHVVLEHGKPVVMIGIGINVTERREAAGPGRLLAAIVNSSEDAIISKDLQGRILSWNAAAERMFGYHAEDVVGKSIEFLMPPEKTDDYLSILSRIRRGERIQHYETRRRRSDGSLIEVALTVSPIHDESGRVIGSSKIASDLTAIREAQQERERTRELLLGTLGHDLRNPLNAVVASLYYLNKHVPESMQHVVARMFRSCERMTRMIDQLLDFTRARLGEGLRLEPRAADLRDICVSVVEEIEARHPSRVHLKADVNFPGQWDADRLAQVLSNLLDNALDHGSPTDPVEVRLGQENGAVRLDVSNRGRPIPESMREAIFEPFRRASAEVGTARQGLGLGLYITREIAQSHGGSVEVASGEEQTTFTVRLPLRPEQPAPGA